MCGLGRARSGSTSEWSGPKGYGLRVDVPWGLDGLEGADTVIAMPWWGGEGLPDVPHEVLDAIRRAAARGARMVSFCSGAFVLAAAGTLDGRPATTHWQEAPDLAAEYPAIDVDPDVLFVDDGQVLTSAGAAASFDLALHLVRLDHGADVADTWSRAASWCRRTAMVGRRSSWKHRWRPSPGADPFRETLDWAVEHLDEPLSVADLAERSLMSPRSFARRFRSDHGDRPHQWLLRQRVVLAQRLLETTDEPVERIAQLVGFGAAATLRMHFQRVLHTTPMAYRRAFCPAASETA